MSNQREFLLWMDMETTGLEPYVDDVLELAAVLTDTSLNELGTYESVVAVNRVTALHRMISNSAVEKMHRDNGLLDALRSKDLPRLGEVESEVVELIDRLAPNGTVYLAGSGVSHFDHHVIMAQMPALASKLHYAAIDVGSPRRMFQMATGSPLVTANDRKTHRAMDDVRCHLEDAAAFWELFRRNAGLTEDGVL